MDFLFFDDIRKKPYLIPALIIVSSVAALLMNVYGLKYGLTYVLPHLFYLPIIIAAYYYPRRGVLFAVGLSVIYCAVSFTVVTPTTVEMLSAIARSGVFIVIGGVVSYLSGRMHHDTQMCRRLVSVVRSSADAISGETPDGIVTDWNAGAELLYGYTSHEMKGTSIFRLIPPELHEEKRLLLEKIRQGELVERVETERIKKDGTRILISLSLSPILDSVGEIIGISGIAHDITERQRFQNEILQAKDRWELTFDAVPDMIAIIDDHFRIVQVNKAMADRLRVLPKDAVGLKCYEVVHDSNNPPAICPHQLLLKDGQNHSTDIHEDNLNGDFFLTVSPIRDPAGTVLGSVHILRDISERKKAEIQLQESERKYRSIFNSFPDIYYQMDLNGIITVLSPSVKQLSGWAPEDLIGHPVIEIYPFPEQRAGLLEELSRTGDVHGYEVALRHKDGRHVQTSVSAHLVCDDAGKPVAIEGTIRDITETRRTEDALRESEEKYRVFFATSMDCVFITSLDGKWVDFNDEAIRIFGYTSREELMDVKISDRYANPADRDAHIRHIREKGYSQEYPVDFRKKDGTIISTLITTIPRKDREGNIIQFHGTIRDITDRKRAEEALHESEERFRTLSETSLTGIYIFVDGVVKYANPTFAKLVGYTPQEMIGMNPMSYIHPDDRAIVRERMASRLDRKEEISVYDCRMVTKDNRTLFVSIMGVLIPYEGRLVISGNLMDITDRKRAEEALRESEERYRVLFDESPISLWEEDLSDIRYWIDTKRGEGIRDFRIWFETHPEDVESSVRMVNITRINRATLLLFKAKSRKEFSDGLSSVFTYESYNAFQEEIIALASGKTEFESEIPFQTLTGEKRIVMLKMIVVPGYEQTFEKIVISFIDITERKLAEEALHQVNEKLTMLNSITRHDILNQLMGLQAYLELSKEDVTDPVILTYIEKEEQAAKAIQWQIEFTRNYQDIGTQAPKWQIISEIISSAIRQLDPPGIDIGINVADVELYADPLIEKVFYNLMENSLRHGDHVTHMNYSVRETEGNLILTYSDNGVGITKEDKEKLFRKGFGKHTGLGMFLSREILSITGITITETGESGKGARFEITVPEGAWRFAGT